MAEMTTEKLFYQNVNELDLVGSKHGIALDDLLVLVQSDTTRRVSITTLMAKIIDNIDVEDGLSAYEIAVNNGFEGTEKEWLEYLANSDELRAIAGNYRIIDAGWSGTGIGATLMPVDSSVTFTDADYIIYRVQQENGYTYKYYTINKNGDSYDEWNGILNIFDIMRAIVKSYAPDDNHQIYAGVSSSTTFEYDISTGKVFTYDPTDSANPWTQIRISQTELGVIYNVKRSVGDYGEWYYNNYGVLTKYEGVVQYIHDVANVIAAKLAAPATSANKLNTARNINILNTSNETMGSTKFDGSADASIKLGAKSVKANMLEVDDNDKVPINISGTAEKLATARAIKFNGYDEDNVQIITGSTKFDGSADINVKLTVNSTKLVAGKAEALAKPVNIVVVGGGTNQGKTSTNADGSINYHAYTTDPNQTGSVIYTQKNPDTKATNEYDGEKPTELVLTGVSTKVLYMEDDVAANIDISGNAKSADTFKVASRNNTTDMLFVGTANSGDLAGNQSVLYEPQIHVRNENSSGVASSSGSPTIVSPQFHGNLIGDVNGNAATASQIRSKKILINNYGLGTSSKNLAVKIYYYSRHDFTAVKDASSLSSLLLQHSADLRVKAQLYSATGVDPYIVEYRISGQCITEYGTLTTQTSTEKVYFSPEVGVIFKGTSLSNIFSGNVQSNSISKAFYANKISGPDDIDMDFYFKINKLSDLQFVYEIWAVVDTSKLNDSIKLNNGSLTISVDGAGSYDNILDEDISNITAEATISETVITALKSCRKFAKSNSTQLEDGLHRTLSTYYPSTANNEYYHRNIGMGTSATPSSDNVYGGNGAIWIKY